MPACSSQVHKWMMRSFEVGDLVKWIGYPGSSMVGSDNEFQVGIVVFVKKHLGQKYYHVLWSKTGRVSHGCDPVTLELVE